MQLKEARNSPTPTQVKKKKKKRSNVDLNMKLHPGCNGPCRESTQNPTWLYKKLSWWISQAFKPEFNTVIEIWTEVCKPTAGYYPFPEKFLTARELCLSKVWGSVEQLLLGKKTNYIRLKKNHRAWFWGIMTPSHARNKAAHNNPFCLLFFLYSSVSTCHIFLIKLESVWDINFFFLLCLFINHHSILFIIDEPSGTTNQILK